MRHDKQREQLPAAILIELAARHLTLVKVVGGLGSIEGTLVSGFLVGQVVSLGSLIYAPLAQMAPFAIMLLILLIKPTGLYGSPLLKR
jgi:branched-chain amino acid transport system permease protein